MAYEGVANKIQINEPNPGFATGVAKTMFPEIEKQRQNERDRANLILQGMIAGNVRPNPTATAPNIGQRIAQGFGIGANNSQLNQQYNFLQNPQRMLMNNLFGGGEGQQPIGGQPANSGQPTGGKVLAAFKTEDALAKIPESERGKYIAKASNVDLLGIPVTTFTPELKPDYQAAQTESATGETIQKNIKNLQDKANILLQQKASYQKGWFGSEFMAIPERKIDEQLRETIEQINELQKQMPTGNNNIKTVKPDNTTITKPLNNKPQITPQEAIAELQRRARGK